MIVNFTSTPDVAGNPRALAQVLGTELLDDEVQPRVINLLKQCRNALPKVLQALPSHPDFAKLTPEQRARLETAISS